MAKGRDPADWAVTVAGDDGTLSCAEYRGRFNVRRSGVVQIIWQGGGPGPGEDGPVNRAAQTAIAAAMKRPPKGRPSSVD